MCLLLSKKHTDTISALDEICNLLYNVSKQIWGISRTVRHTPEGGGTIKYILKTIFCMIILFIVFAIKAN